MAANLESPTEFRPLTKDLLTPEQHPEFWYIHGKAYDLTDFVDRHPGGSRALLLTRGRDCTEMFESYHCLTDKPKQVMTKFMVGAQHDYKPIFNWTDPKVNAFHKEIVTEVRQWVNENNIDIKCSNFRMTWLSVLYLFVLWFTVKFYWMEGAFWSIIPMPILWWSVFVNSFHDASHFAISRNLWVTNFWTYAYPWFSSPTTWDHQHVIAHHVHTNMHKLDPDLNHGMPLYRVNPRFRFRYAFHFQIYFAWVIWGIATFYLANVFDILAIVEGKYHGVIPYQKMRGWRLAGHAFGRLSAIFLHLGIPMMLFPFWQAVLWSISFNFIFSFCFMATTQINHLTPACMAAAEKNQACWAVHQVTTAQAFAHDSNFWWLFAGGLNFQIEHHLFPGINHEHLPAIKPIVVRACKKYGIPYAYSETYSQVFWQYVDVVRRGSLEIHPGFS